MEVLPFCQTKMFHLNIMFHLEAAETGGVNFLGGNVNFPIVNVGSSLLIGKLKSDVDLLKPSLDAFYGVIWNYFSQNLLYRT